MDIARVVLLALHIISAGLWIAQFPAELGFNLARRTAQGTPGELPMLIAEMRVLGFLGQIGGPGILLTGLGLIGVERLGFINIGGITPNWLLVKQIIYLVALLIFIVGVVPATRRLRPLLMAAAQNASGITPEIRQLSERMLLISRFTNLLVLVNIVLAVWKPAF
jgi:hypothetical protein